MSSIQSTRRIVQNAINAKAVDNAGVKAGNFEVTIETVDFSGNRTQSKNMTASQLKAWLNLIHQDGSDAFLEKVASSPRGQFMFNILVHPTVTIKAM